MWGFFFVRGHYLSLPAFFVDQIRHEIHRLRTHRLHFMCINIQSCADFRMTQNRRNGLDTERPLPFCLLTPFSDNDKMNF